MKFENVIAKVVKVLPMQSGVGQQSGKEWKKLEFIISTVDREYEKDGEKKQIVNEVKAALWSAKAEELGQYVVEGNNIQVSGEMSANEWNGKYFNEIRVNNVVLISGQTDPTVSPDATDYAENVGVPQNELDDNSGLPF